MRSSAKHALRQSRHRHRPRTYLRRLHHLRRRCHCLVNRYAGVGEDLEKFLFTGLVGSVA